MLFKFSHLFQSKEEDKKKNHRYKIKMKLSYHKKKKKNEDSPIMQLELYQEDKVNPLM